MFYLENNTTFSGSDIRVYAYRSPSDLNGFIDPNETKVRKFNEDPLYPNDPFRNSSWDQIEDSLNAHLEGVASGRPAVDNEGNRNYEAVHTNKISPDYIDIVRTGSDKEALRIGREYQLAKQNQTRNRNLAGMNLDLDGKTFKPKYKPIIELGSLYSITYSSFREKHAVRTLGRVSAKDYTRGQRTIAGSMNFAVFQSHELMEFLNTGENSSNVVLLDQLPKFNLMLVMINEYGGASILHIFNVTISTESQQTSVEDLALMNNVTFYAEDIMTIENVGNLFETSLSMLHPVALAERTLKFYNRDNPTTLSDLMKLNAGNSDGSRIKDIIGKSRGLF